MTETLAKIYVKQGKYEDALKAYKILCLKYPEKISLFANQIDFIKNKLKNEQHIYINIIFDHFSIIFR